MRILFQDQKVAFGVAFKEGVVVDVRDGGAPGGGEVSRDFGEGVWGAGFAGGVADDGDGFHDVCYGDEGAGDGDVDGGGGGAVGGEFGELGGGRKGENYDLDGELERWAWEEGETYGFHESGYDLAVHDC